jgi:metal-sulfur cluster biosynthetic enzyme
VNVVNEELVREALKNVIDPELRLSIIDLGLVYEVDIKDSTVKVIYTLTTPACPLGPVIDEQIQDVLGDLPGMEEVITEIVFSPPWDPRTMASDEIKMQLGIW